MHAIVLAGGFARRLRPLSDATPKPLLKVGGRPIIDFVIDRIMEVKAVSSIQISINLKFRNQFEEWLRSRNLPNSSLAVDQAMREEEKPGAVVALTRITEDVNDDCLIVGGDNLFTSSLKPVVDRFKATGRPIMGIYNLDDKELARQYSAISLDSEGRIVSLVEKPTNPHSSLIGTAIYVLPKETLPRFGDFTKTARNRDSPGRFFEWLYKQQPVYGVILEGEWWDIGTLDQYEKVNRIMTESPTTAPQHGR